MVESSTNINILKQFSALIFIYHNFQECPHSIFYKKKISCPTRTTAGTDLLSPHYPFNFNLFLHQF